MSYGAAHTSEAAASSRAETERHSAESGPSHSPETGPLLGNSGGTGADDGFGRQDAEQHEEVENEQQHPAILHRLRGFYERNLGLALVFLAQTFGSVMSTAAKLLTSPDSPNRFHAVQIIFVRMLATSVLGMLYMYCKSVPDFPLGKPSVRGLLVMRGTAGFVGLFGLYYSLSYLEISDATAISFLVPTWTALVCFVWLKEPYRPQEALCGLVSLIGVLFIARPAFLFGRRVAVDPISGDPVEDADMWTAALSSSSAAAAPPPGLVSAPSPTTPAQRTMAILVSVLGTCAAAVAYGTIRVIGRRAHSLVSVNYFAVLATLGSALIILVHPDLRFVLPRGALQWSLVTIIGIAGFLLQFLLTEGLQREKGGRATNVIYIQMVFALVIERVIWGTTPPVLSFVGSALIICASVWLSMQKSAPDGAAERQKVTVADEESRLLGSEPSRT